MAEGHQLAIDPDRVKKFKAGFIGLKKKGGKLSSKASGKLKVGASKTKKFSKRTGTKAKHAAKVAGRKAQEIGKELKKETKSGTQEAGRMFFNPMKDVIDARVAAYDELVESTRDDTLDEDADVLYQAALAEAANVHRILEIAEQEWERGAVITARRTFKLVMRMVQSRESQLQRVGIEYEDDPLEDSPFDDYVPKWQRVDDSELDSGSEAAFLQAGQTFRSNALSIKRKELGMPSLKDLRKEVLGEGLSEEEEVLDELGLDELLEHSGEDEEDQLLLSDEQDEVEHFDQNQLKAVIKKVKGAIPESDGAAEIKQIALAMAEIELERLMSSHGSWKEALLSLGLGGPALYLEEHVLDTIVDHLDMTLKEGVPMGKSRKGQEIGINVLEGVTDVAWNSASFAAEAVFSPLTNFGTGAIGASYKGLAAGGKSKLEGADKAKAGAVAAVTWVLEFLQALIPGYGSAMGITGGLKNLAETSTVPDRLTNFRRGFSKNEGPSTFEKKFLALLEERIDYADDLLSQAEDLDDSVEVAEEVEKIEDMLAYLVRQRDKTAKRV